MNSDSVAINNSTPASAASGRPAQAAKLAALGIVFGDLGTSPLYTLQAVVQAIGGQFTPSSALGVLSLIFWTLVITISIKYCLFVMRADNRGEGGILALMSLVGANGFVPGFKFLTAMGLLGAALIYGDGVITPAISVLSALEGVNVATDTFKPFVMPAAVLILVVLFATQRFGSERIGRTFGPVMLLWFVVIAVLGAVAIAHHPEVIAAIDPRHAIGFLVHSGGRGLLVLGGVFLCITGGEALYADMGHFGKGPIRWSWYAIVLPALLLSYAGQTAFIMEKGTVTGNPFFQIAPAWSLYPLVALATIATIIASQAIITGSFSMTRQAMQLGWLPGVSIRQTSDRIYGQIYVPVGQLAADDGHGRHHHRVRELGSAGGRLRYGRIDHHAAHDRAALQGDARCVALAFRRRNRGARYLPRGGRELFLREPSEDRGGRLVAVESGRGALLDHDHLAHRHRSDACRAHADSRGRGAVFVGFEIRRDSPRRRHHRVPDPQQAKGLAAHHGSRAFHRGTSAQGNRSQCRVREHAAHQRAEVYGHRLGGRRSVAPPGAFRLLRDPGPTVGAASSSPSRGRPSISTGRCSSLPGISWCASRGDRRSRVGALRSLRSCTATRPKSSIASISRRTG